MLHRWSLLRGCLGAAVAITLGAGVARASDPLPGDLVVPPANVNIGLFYNEFNDAGRFGQVHGGSVGNSTHLSDDILVGRYIRTFEVDGFNAGVQVYVPFVGFVGAQRVGQADIPTPVAGLPNFGPGHANLSSNTGFDQPNFSAFFYPYDNPATGTSVVISPWISPPISSFDKTRSLNPGTENVWTFEMEEGVRTLLLGTPKGYNVSIEVWDTTYLFGHNSNSAVVNPEVYANNIPPIYSLFGVHNPLQRTSYTNATFREQPSNEVRVYLPFQVIPKTLGFIAPGIYQSFGGKATYRVPGAGIVDSGTRTNETQLRLIAQSFVSPSMAVLLAGYYDIKAHGGPLNRTVLLRVAVFF